MLNYIVQTSDTFLLFYQVLRIAPRRLGHAEHEVPPEFSIQPEVEIAHIGSDVTFKCAARGSPEPAIRWSKNGVELEEARDQEYLAYENVGEEHIGTYACNASNVAGYTYKVSCVDLNLIIILVFSRLV